MHSMNIAHLFCGDELCVHTVYFIRLFTLYRLLSSRQSRLIEGFKNWILIFWLHFKSADLGVIYFQTWEYNLKKIYIHLYLLSRILHVLKVSRLTFSPIIVLSPDFSISTSGFKAQALIVLSYLALSIFFPNKTLFLREAFWIQACCGTYAEVPC